MSERSKSKSRMAPANKLQSCSNRGADAGRRGPGASLAGGRTRICVTTPDGGEPPRSLERDLASLADLLGSEIAVLAYAAVPGGSGESGGRIGITRADGVIALIIDAPGVGRWLVRVDADSAVGIQAPAPAARTSDDPEIAKRLALRPREAARALGIRERHFRNIGAAIPQVRAGGAVLVPIEAIQDWLRARQKRAEPKAGDRDVELLLDELERE